MKTFHSRLTCFLEVLVCLSFLSFFTMVILLVGLRLVYSFVSNYFSLLCNMVDY